MATVYVTQDPIALDAFEQTLKELGWERGERDGASYWGNGTQYIHDVGVTEVKDGSKHVGFTCYAGNYPSEELEEQHPMWTEHHDEFWELCGGDEDEEPLTIDG